MMPLPESFANDVVAVFRQTLDGELIDCNDACAKMLGYASAAEILEKGSLDYLNRSDVVTVGAALQDLLTLSNVEVAIRRQNGSVAWVLQNLRLTPTDRGMVVDVAMFDVTEQRVATQRFEYQAYHDSITGLPNRMLFVDRSNVALAQARRRGACVGMVVADIDDFTEINERYGRGFGDRLLRAVGERLATTVREDDAVARLDSDDFTVLLAGLPYASDAAIAATRIMDVISEPFVIGDETIQIRTSLGIAIAPSDGDEVETLVRHASVAAVVTAERGGNAFRFYEPELNVRALERAAMVAGLRRAIDNGELEVHYQPAVNLQTGAIHCIEALLRWRHPDLGLIASADFLAAAEQGGMLPSITELVVAKAFRQLREWHDSGLSQLRIAVNLLASQLGGRAIPTLFAEAAKEFNIATSSVEVEFPEVSLLNHSTHDVLRAMKEIDLLLAIDDFGTGGCSITDLKRLPVDTIKIAPMLVKNMLRHVDDAAIVQAMIGIARAMDLRVVAEGVESKAQFSYLLEKRCAEMQGFFVARPAPASALTEMLRMQHH